MSDPVDLALERDWRAFAAGWDWRADEPRAKAEKRFRALDGEARGRAVAAAPTWAERVKRKLSRRCSAERFLRERLFDNFAGRSTLHSGVATPRVFVRLGTAAFDAWEREHRRTEGTRPLFRHYVESEKATGFYRPSLFPPRTAPAADPSASQEG